MLTFEQTVAANVIGSFCGFVAALGVYYIKEARTRQTKRAAIVKNLRYELTYNVVLYDQFAAEVQNAIEAISNDVRAVYLNNLEYKFVAHYFARQFYQEGLLAKYFHAEDMKRWNTLLTAIYGGAEKYVHDSVDAWREHGAEKEATFKALRNEKNDIDYAKKMTEYILSRLPDA